MQVKDKVCVVTGAAGGIGEAIARGYAAAETVTVDDSMKSEKANWLQGEFKSPQQSLTQQRARAHDTTVILETEHLPKRFVNY